MVQLCTNKSLVKLLESSCRNNNNLIIIIIGKQKEYGHRLANTLHYIHLKIFIQISQIIYTVTPPHRSRVANKTNHLIRSGKFWRKYIYI